MPTACPYIVILLTPQRAAAEGRNPLVSVALEYMGMVLAYSCLAVETQIFQAYPYSLGNGAP